MNCGTCEHWVMWEEGYGECARAKPIGDQMRMENPSKAWASGSVDACLVTTDQFFCNQHASRGEAF